MLMNYSKLLTEHGLTVDGVPVKTQGKIKTLEKLNAAIASEEAELVNITSKRAKASAEKNLADSKDAGQLLDDEICEAIQRYVANKDHYDRQSQKLRETTAARKNKAAGLPAAGDPPAPNPPAGNPPAPVKAAAPTEEPPAGNPPASDAPPAGDPPAPVTPADDKPKKKSSGIGWLLGGLALVGLAAIGINYKRNN